MPKAKPQGFTGNEDSLVGDRIASAIVAAVGTVGFKSATEEQIIERAGVGGEQFYSLYSGKTALSGRGGGEGGAEADEGPTRLPKLLKSTPIAGKSRVFCH